MTSQDEACREPAEVPVVVPETSPTSRASFKTLMDGLLGTDVSAAVVPEASNGSPKDAAVGAVLSSTGLLVHHQNRAGDPDETVHIEGPRHDIGWAVLDTVRAHRYDYVRPCVTPGKEDDRGWHACRCGWEGYWTGFEPHLTDSIISALTAGPCANHGRYGCSRCRP